jgi:hypothetical protein
MHIDWAVFATLAAPILALLVGAALNHFIENRPKVVSYLGHVSGILLNRNNQPFQVNSHSVVLRNAGRRTAKNVRLGHVVLPDFQVSPDIQHTVNSLPGGSKEILFPQLVPQKQVTITYLYFPPLTWNQVNTHVESDDGPVKILNVLPTVQMPRWQVVVIWSLIGYGVIALAYSVYALYRSHMA